MIIDPVELGTKAIEGAILGYAARQGIKHLRDKTDDHDANWEKAADMYERAHYLYELCISRIASLEHINNTDPRDDIEEKLTIRRGYVELYFFLIEDLCSATLPPDADLPVSHNIVHDIRENLEHLDHQRKDLIPLYTELVDTEWRDRLEQ